MTINLKGMVNYQEKRKAFIESVKNGDPQEKQNELYEASMNALAEDMVAEAKKKLVWKQKNLSMLQKWIKILHLKK